ncbi:unnamed protein product [Urochloa decumbens]|uniref:Uncharacterized protein n=1 Tax=Urochloa decumbens TaxID=240449 RepID=A0ABC8YMK8_9POAL
MDRGVQADEEAAGPMAALLPDDVVANVLRPGYYYLSEFFSCPASAAAGPSAVSGKHDYLPEAAGSRSWGHVRDHCNGLLLVHGPDHETLYVLNPATRWVAPLPPCPPPPAEMDALEVEHLVYDPAVSPDYEVVSVSRFHYRLQPGDYLYDSSRDRGDPAIEQSEWPPSVWILQVFSSTTGQWEERSFAREGEAVGTIADMRRHWGRMGYKWNAVYWRGALYVQCQADYVMRISLSSHKYHVIKPPAVIIGQYSQLYLGRSAKGMSIQKHQWKRNLNGAHKHQWMMRYLHRAALMMNAEAPMGTWIFLDFIHAKRLYS